MRPDPNPERSPDEDPQPSLSRRRLLGQVSGGALVVLGGVYLLSDPLTRQARAQTRADGRPRLPPGQHVLERLKPMGGEPGDPALNNFRLRVHGEVEKPFELTFAQLLELPQANVSCDVHCVTGWSVLGASFEGVRVAELARRAGVKSSARHVVFEAAHGYTANVPRAEALDDSVLLAHRYDGKPLTRANGAPVRALVPNLYFWKSAKWLTGIRFVTRDEPGYWETRGYHNHGDPWREERYS
jgi:DMSO/TMAO reductase YedYZ molybdopterin-dependent catalytic subunit